MVVQGGLLVVQARQKRCFTLGLLVVQGGLLVVQAGHTGVQGGLLVVQANLSSTDLYQHKTPFLLQTISFLFSGACSTILVN